MGVVTSAVVEPVENFRAGDCVAGRAKGRFASPIGLELISAENPMQLWTLEKPMCTFWLLVLVVGLIQSWATFSIVAVDTVTGQVGSAGASCIDNGDVAGGAFIISDVIPGKGAIHTQAAQNATNKLTAHNRMVAGDSPQQILTYVTLHDVTNDSTTRQYGVVDLYQGSSRSAGFTGANCMNYKAHLTGKNYSIQGNILKGSPILDSIRVFFNRTQGTLADKLMAALQGAKVPGADSRCLAEGVSTKSAFIRVAKSTDAINKLYLDINLAQRPKGKEPIDSLQKLYDKWKATVSLVDKHLAFQGITVQIERTRIIWGLNANLAGQSLWLSLYSLTGEKVFRLRKTATENQISMPLPTHKSPGLYMLRMDGQSLDWRQLVLLP